MNEFNEICEFTLFAYILWTMLEVATLLLTLQFQLVEYGAYLKVNERQFELYIKSNMRIYQTKSLINHLFF